MRLLRVLAILYPIGCTGWLAPRPAVSNPSALLISELQREQELDQQSEVAKKASFDTYMFFLPPALSAVAFLLYKDTNLVFHNFIQEVSGHTWTAADGGKYMAEIVRPILNGPVTLSISILLGTLVAMTISTLYQRQITIHRVLISIVEETREFQLLVEGFPEPYRQQAKILLDKDITERFKDFDEGRITSQTVRKKEMASMVMLLNKLSQDPECPSFIGNAYDHVYALKNHRTELIAALETVFAPAHYGNIGILAFTLLFIFLLETDQAALQFLLDFQLSICWALLIGSFTMLGVVIYDLSTPFTGIFSAYQRSEYKISDIRSYALTLDRLHSESCDEAST